MKGFVTGPLLTLFVVPVLVLHSPDDEIIAYSLGQKLYQAALPPKDF